MTAATAGTAIRPLERAQLVWHRAVMLSAADRDQFVVVLDLLRTAHHGPSTMLHALALGEAQQRATPDDVPTRKAVGLLSSAVTWLGKRTEAGEVGRSGRPRITPPRL